MDYYQKKKVDIREYLEYLRIDANSKMNEIGDELADIIIVACTIANRSNVDLEDAFRKKEEINKKRFWK